MKFVIVDPKERSATTVDCDHLNAALRKAGLISGEVDHGSMGRKIGYCVYEFGMFVPAAEQHYCSIAGRLIAGACVLYGVDDVGETVDLMVSQIPDVRYYLGANDVEAAIESGEVKRPVIAVNDDVQWRWPDPAPAGMMR